MTNYETVRQAALRLGVTERTIQLWAKSGQLAGARKVGRDWMIPADEFDDPDEEATERSLMMSRILIMAEHRDSRMCWIYWKMRVRACFRV